MKGAHMQTRLAGFYWVLLKEKGAWQPAFFHADRDNWALIGLKGRRPDDEIFETGPPCLKVIRGGKT